ncbi:MAG: hypothetical protein JNL24_04610 [Bacteroidia bacterium]|nr:hypothetical protein [Bacteroidia bacterium]
MDVITILEILSGIIGIIGFFFPIEWKKKIIIKLMFSLILLLLTSYIVFQNSKINRIEKISKSANLLINKKSMEFSNEGFILAALSFLEQQKNDFPESYERAKMIFEKYDKNEYRSIESVRVSSEMEGLIKGIGILSTVKDE